MIYRYTTTIFLLFICGLLSAQQKSFKEVKSTSLSQEWNTKDDILILGERTFITINTWSNNKVQADIEIVARHADQKQAQADLEKIDIHFQRQSKKITYSNSIKIKSPKDKPQSNLKVYLTLWIPDESNLIIKNKFGEVKGTGSLNSLDMNLEFTSLELKSFSSKVKVTSKMGDAKLENISGSLELNMDRSEAFLSDIKGSISGEFKYCNLDAYLMSKSLIKEIKAEFTPIKFYLNEQFKNQIKFECFDCKIHQVGSGDLLMLSNIDEKYEALLNSSSSNIGKVKSQLEDIQIIFTNEQSN